MDDDGVDRQGVTEQMRRRLQIDFEGEENLVENMSTIIASYSDVALALSDRQEKELAMEVQTQMKELLMLREKTRYHKEALQSLANSYQCPEEGTPLTDFKEIMDAKARELAAASSFLPEDTQEFTSLLRDIGGRGAEGKGATEELGEDEEIIIDSGSGFAPNDTCPLSLKPIMEIDDPVEDAKGIVYEREFIEASLRREATNSHVCPVAGTNHTVRLRDLVPARRVRRERKRQFCAATGEDEPKEGVEEDDVL